MTALTRAIVSHDLAAITAALRENPGLAAIPENGWLPMEWAVKTGNLVTLMRVARLLDAPDVEHGALFRQYVAQSTTNHFGGGSVASTAEQLWEQAIENRDPRPFRKEESDVRLTPEGRLDVAYLLGKAGIGSLDELRALVRSKDDQ